LLVPNINFKFLKCKKEIVIFEENVKDANPEQEKGNHSIMVAFLIGIFLKF